MDIFKTIVLAIVLSILVAIFAMTSGHRPSVADVLVPIFFCSLIVGFAGVILQKIDALSKRIDKLSKGQCLCQKVGEQGDDEG